MELVFVRHGQTEWNREEKVMGQVDIDLDEVGRLQCKELVAQLSPDFEVIFSSPLKRARTTAQIIADQFSKDIILKDTLKERDMGSLSGKTWAEVHTLTGVDMAEVIEKSEYDFHAFGGESAEDVRQRVQSFLDEVSKVEYKKVLVVCHSGIISIMETLFPEAPKTEILNASVHTFIL